MDLTEISYGWWARKAHEILLIGRKGDQVGCPPESLRQPSVWTCRRGEHSQKPDAIYDYIADVYQGLPLVEGFARGPRVGWDVWGNQAHEVGVESGLRSRPQASAGADQRSGGRLALPPSAEGG